VESATTEAHRRILGTLGTIANLAAREDVQAPALLIIGEVAAFAESLSWFENAARLSAAR
jgi:siroheme synthase